MHQVCMPVFGASLQCVTDVVAFYVNWLTHVCEQGIEDILHDEQTGFAMITTDDIDVIGVAGVIDRIRARVGAMPVYLRSALVL